MDKIVTFGNFKERDIKDLVEPKEIWFLKDVETNKYYSLLSTVPNEFEKRHVKNMLNGREFMGFPIYSDKNKDVKLKRKFKIVSVFDYIKDIKKESEEINMDNKKEKNPAHEIERAPDGTTVKVNKLICSLVLEKKD